MYHSKKKLRMGTPLSFRKILVSKKLWVRREGGEETGELLSFSVGKLSENFCFTVARNFVGYAFIVSLISGIEKNYA